MSRESEMVVVKSDESGKPTVWCDPELVPIVKALNDAGIATVASCSGHGYQPGSVILADGTEIRIFTYEQARLVDKMFPGINGEPAVGLGGEREKAAKFCDGLADRADLWVGKEGLQYFRLAARSLRGVDEGMVERALTAFDAADGQCAFYTVAEKKRIMRAALTAALNTEKPK